MRHNYAHPALSDFAQLAESLCRAIANDDARDPINHLRAIHQLLPQVYAGDLHLPPTSVLFDENSPESVNEKSPALAPAKAPLSTVSINFDNLAELLGLSRYYREIFDPYADRSDAEVTGDIFDDLSGIYDDLSSGLAQWKSGNSGEALWEWRFNFEIHWGEHATSALRALFALSAWQAYPWPDGTES